MLQMSNDRSLIRLGNSSYKILTVFILDSLLVKVCFSRPLSSQLALPKML